MNNLAIGTTEDITIFSKELNEDIDLIVYTPAGFTPFIKYSCLIVQDGRDYFTLGRLPKVLEQLSQAEQIDPTMIVGIPYKDKIDRYRKYHPNGKKHKQFVRFLVHELVPFIDNKYPTNQTGKGRILMGSSMGATVSLLTALEYPHMFGKIVMQSPMVNDEVLKRTMHFTEPHLIELYHVIGKEETKMITTKGVEADFFTPNRELHKIITEKRISHFYDEIEGNHTWKSWQPDVQRALEKILS